MGVGYHDNVIEVMGMCEDDVPVSDSITLGKLREIVSDIAPNYPFRKVYLFGSRARGDYYPNSDYDFCIVPDESYTMLDMGGFLMDMQDALCCEISVVSEKGMDKRFLEAIINERKLIYEI